MTCNSFMASTRLALLRLALLALALSLSAAAAPWASPRSQGALQGQADGSTDLRAQLEELQASLDLVEESQRGAMESALGTAAEALAARDAARTRSAASRAEARTAREQVERRAGAAVVGPEVELPPPAADLDVLQDAAARLRAEVRVAREVADELAAESTLREQRVEALPEELARARQAADQQAVPAETGGDADGVPGLEARAQTLAARAASARAAAELEALVAEQELVAARIELLPFLRAEAQRRIAALDDAQEALQSRLDLARQAEAERLEAEAAQARRDVARRTPVLAALAKDNEAIAKRLTEASTRLEGVQSSDATLDPRAVWSGAEEVPALADLERALEQLRARQASTRAKVQRAGLSSALGIVLQRELERLPSAGALRRRADELRRGLAEDQLTQIEMEEERVVLLDPEAALESVIYDLESSGVLVDAGLREAARDVLTRRLELVTSLEDRAQELVEDESAAAVVLDALAAEAETFREFIQERILWTRAPARDRLVHSTDALATANWLLDPVVWARAWSRAARAALERPLLPLFLGLTLAGLLVRRRALRRSLGELADEARSFRTDHFGLSVRALAVSVALAAPAGIALLLAAHLLALPSDQEPVAVALGEALRRAALFVFAFELLRAVVLPKGLGEGHLRWPGAATRHLRLQLLWFVPLGALLLTANRTLSDGSAQAFAGAVQRMLLAACLLVLVVFVVITLRPRGPLFADSFRRAPGGPLERSAWAWFGAAVVVPLALAVMALLGYGYGAERLAELLGNTLLLILGVVLSYGLLLRWLRVERRKLLVEQARQRARAKLEEDPDDPAATTVDEDEINVAAIDQQTRRLFRTGSLLAVALGVYLIWASALPALSVLERVQLWPTLQVLEDPDALSALPVLEEPSAPDPATSGTELAAGGGEAPAAGETPVVTLSNVLGAVLALLLMSVAARNLPGLLEIVLLKRLSMDAGSRYAVGALVRYGIVIVGSTLALSAIGIGWSNVQWLAAALTFGLGFGLQEIFANFVSGLILLIERPVRVGDIVTVAGVEGRVTQIHMRSTTITDWDRRELLVPNREFITSSLINWTLTDPITRVVVPVGIAYGADTRRARGLLIRCAYESGLVLEDPKPRAIFRSFGDSALLFELRTFIANRDTWPDVVDDLHQRIDDAFRDAGIEISFPQLDLHVRSAGPLEESLRTRVDPDVGPAGPGEGQA